MSIDYKNMQVGERERMPVLNVWEGQNQALYREIQDHCQTLAPAPQYEVQTVRELGKPMEFWLQRTR